MSANLSKSPQNIFTPPTRRDAYSHLYSLGAHFVLWLCDNPQVRTSVKEGKPDRDKYQRPENRPSLVEVLAHARRGGIVGLIPQSVGLTGLDIDNGNPAELLDAFPPLVAVPSGGLVRWHFYYHADFPVRDVNWQYLGCSGEIRSSGLMFLWHDAAIALSNALRQEDERRPFPDQALGPHSFDREGKVDSRNIKELRAEAVKAAREARAPSRERKGNRNETMFRYSRLYAYRLVKRETWRDLFEDVAGYAFGMNKLFSQPLRARHVLSTARSITNYCWDNADSITLSSVDPRLQAARGMLSGIKRRMNQIERNRKIWELRDAGVSTLHIQIKTGKISRRQIQRICAREYRDTLTHLSLDYEYILSLMHKAYLEGMDILNRLVDIRPWESQPTAEALPPSFNPVQQSTIDKRNPPTQPFPPHYRRRDWLMAHPENGKEGRAEWLPDARFRPKEGV